MNVKNEGFENFMKKHWSLTGFLGTSFRRNFISCCIYFCISYTCTHINYLFSESCVSSLGRISSLSFKKTRSIFLYKEMHRFRGS